MLEVTWTGNIFSPFLTFEQKTPPKAAALGGVYLHK
jgi:hypothetical protein